MLDRLAAFVMWSCLVSIAIQRIYFLQGNRGGYDMGQRPSHVGHLPQQPLGSLGQYKDETRFSCCRSSDTATDPPKPLLRSHNHDMDKPDTVWWFKEPGDSLSLLSKNYSSDARLRGLDCSMQVLIFNNKRCRRQCLVIRIVTHKASCKQLWSFISILEIMQIYRNILFRKTV